MVHRKLTLVVALALSLCAAAGLSAQTTAAPQAQAPAPAQVLTEGRFISFDIGMAGGMPFNGGAVEVGRYLSVSFNVAGSLSAGFAQIVSGAAQYMTFRVSYFFMPALGASIYLGSDGNPAAGVGIFYDIMKSRSETDLATALKVRLDVLADTTGFTNGRLILGVVTSIGL